MNELHHDRKGRPLHLFLGVSMQKTMVALAIFETRSRVTLSTNLALWLRCFENQAIL